MNERNSSKQFSTPLQIDDEKLSKVKNIIDSIPDKKYYG